MKNTPYSHLPDHCFWKRSVASIAPRGLDPVVAVPFTITATDKVATAGSCFAQHIARYLHNAGFHFLITEPAHPIVNADEAFLYNYGTFTARYGNLYTARQLLQLFHRAYGTFLPIETVWQGVDGGLIDPFRPQIQPNGFASLAEFNADRAKHLHAVRTAFETLDVFVFTLGLTEGWESKDDGAVFPLCPGVAGGVYDESKYQLHNFNVSEVTQDMLDFIDLLRQVNAKAKIILTVSPVPLIATALADQHVLSATTYSKSVLRVACEAIGQQRPEVAYFPSYEIITGNYARGVYFAEDCRSVTEAGVAHVMSVFLKHFAGVVSDANDKKITESLEKQLSDKHLQEMAELVRVNCDEEAIDKSIAPVSGKARAKKKNNFLANIFKR